MLRRHPAGAAGGEFVRADRLAAADDLVTFGLERRRDRVLCLPAEGIYVTRDEIAAI
jgi:hypothetical protein